jgi:uncharacterized protein (TIGR03066 family)
MRAVLFGLEVAVGFAGTARADDDKMVEELKKALVGKWTADNKEVGPVEFKADGTIKEAFGRKDGNWTFAEGTYTVDAKGEIKWKAKSGGVSLGGWYKFKDGELYTARGMDPRVTFMKVEEKTDEKKGDKK